MKSKGDNVTASQWRVVVPGESHNRDKVVYVCHAYAARPSHSVSRLREICRRLVASGVVSLAPQLLFPQFLDEATERDLALKMCLRLVSVCDEMRVFGKPSAGMCLEMAEARRLGIPVVAGDAEAGMALTEDPPR